MLRYFLVLTVGGDASNPPPFSMRDLSLLEGDLPSTGKIKIPMGEF